MRRDEPLRALLPERLEAGLLADHDRYRLQAGRTWDEVLDAGARRIVESREGAPS